MRLLGVIGVGVLATAFLVGCATKPPPQSAEIRQQALTNVALRANWKAGGKTGSIADDWLATFDDQQLEALVHEAMAHLASSPAEPEEEEGASPAEQGAPSQYEAEIAAIPFKWYPPERILDQILACRLLDITESTGMAVDRVIDGGGGVRRVNGAGTSC